MPTITPLSHVVTRARAASPSGTIKVQVRVPPAIRTYFLETEILGHGGFQSLCRQIAEQMRHSPTLTVDAATFRRVIRYATLYGEGGFQSKLRRLVLVWVDRHFEELL